MPKVDAEEPRVAALLLLAALPVEVLVAAPERVEPVEPVELEPVVVALAPPEELAPLVAAPEPDPLSLMEVLMQLVSEPAIIVAWPEKAWVPVLSLRAALKLVLAWRSTSQVKVVPVC